MTAPDLPNSLFILGFIFAKYHIENVISETLLAVESAKGGSAMAWRLASVDCSTECRE